MRKPNFYILLLTLNFFLAFLNQSLAQLPNGFVDELLSADWNTPVGLTFDTNGRMYVWEKGGRVYIVENGQKQPKPLLDLSEEVLDFNDHGMNGFALDPNFLSNGYIYVMYAAKRYYVQYMGTPQFDKQVADEEPFKTTIGRIVRYRCNATDGFKSVDYTSRKILIGETLSTGLPILVDNHGVGSLVFGSDGTLLASLGDGAIIKELIEDDTQNTWFLEAVELGIISAEENVGVYRSQLLNSMNGKILRINPENGEGIPSNPYFDSKNPRSARSRVWAYGLRNPFRFSVKPNTGSKNSADANVGTLLVGDVGWSHREEINVIKKGGQNFGWPIFEGISFQNNSLINDKYFPENAQLPAIDWRGEIAHALVNGEVYDVGSPQFEGDNFTGNASIGGVWHNDTKSFPKEYQNLYFHADYQGWIKGFQFDENLTPKKVISFTPDVNPTCLAIDPKTGIIYYTNYSYPDKSEIRRLYYKVNANLFPQAVLQADRYFGSSPLTIKFNASQSKDPENQPLKYEWNFGDGTKSTEQNPTHTYNLPPGQKKKFTATLSVTDNAQQTATRNLDVFVGAFPPIILESSLDTLAQFENVRDLSVNLSAKAQSPQGDKLTYEWAIVLHHEDHSHFQNSVKNQQTQVTLAAVPCDGQSYFYRIELTVTDEIGLSTETHRDIKPICRKIGESPPTTSGSLTLFGLRKDSQTALLKWAVVVKNQGGFFYDIYRNGKLLRRLDQMFSAVEVPLDKSNIYSEYQVIAKDMAGNVVRSNVVSVVGLPSWNYQLFSFEQLVKLTDLTIAQIERNARNQQRTSSGCLADETLTTSSFIEKTSSTQLISSEKITQTTLYKAGKSILLEAGFKAENHVFEAKIEPCKN